MKPESQIAHVLLFSDESCSNVVRIIEGQLDEALDTQGHIMACADLEKISTFSDLENYVDRVAPSASF